MLLFCRLTSNFASIKIRNVRPLSALCGCAWYHSRAFSPYEWKHKTLGRVSHPKCIINLGCLKGARGGMLNFLIFMHWKMILRSFSYHQQRLGLLCFINSNQNQLIAPNLGLQKYGHMTVKMHLLLFLSMSQAGPGL